LKEKVEGTRGARVCVPFFVRRGHISVPNCGTGQLLGRTVRMNLLINDGKHSYDFEYTLPDAK